MIRSMQRVRKCVNFAEMVQLIVLWQIEKYQNRENFMEKSLAQLSTPMKHVMMEITLRTMVVSVVM